MPQKKKSRATTAAAEVKQTTASSKPTDHVPLLYYNKVKGTTNLTNWEEKVKVVLGKEFGRGADFLETGAKHVPDAIPNPAADAFSNQNDPHGIQLKLYEKKKTRREQLIASMEEDYPKMYNYILSYFSADSLERVKQDTDFRAAEVAKCPVLLMPIWRRTHNQAQSGSADMDEEAATRLYYACTQDDSCSLTNHKKEFDSLVAGMVASGGTQPTPEKLAARFIASLNPKRYAQMQVD
jgi:hypothetical protein